MPVYEYLCAKCEHEFEREQRITEDPVKTCPKCKARRVKRLISQTSFVLKGGGWYADGYGDKSSKKDAKSDDGGSDSAKSESKDTKSEKSDSGSKSSGDGDGKGSSSPGKKAKKSKKSGKAAA